MNTPQSHFITQAAQSGCRADGRQHGELRKISITYWRGDNKATAEVCYGKTRVTCAVEAEVTIPYPDRPTEGFLSFNVDLSPVGSLAFESGRPSAQAIELTRVLERIIKDSRAIDTEALCIVSGEKVWSVKAEAHVLDHNGNILDATVLATIAALQHFRRSDVTVHGETVTVHSSYERTPVPLSIHHVPVALSFGLFDSQGKLVIVDPTQDEEAVMKGSMTFSLNAFDEICAVHKPGRIPVGVDTIMKCMSIAAREAKQLCKFLKASLTQAEALEQQKMMKKHAAAAGVQQSSSDSAKPGLTSSEREAAAAQLAAAATLRLAPPSMPTQSSGTGSLAAMLGITHNMDNMQLDGNNSGQPDSKLDWNSGEANDASGGPKPPQAFARPSLPSQADDMPRPSDDPVASLAKKLARAEAASQQHTASLETAVDDDSMVDLKSLAKKPRRPGR